MMEENLFEDLDALRRVDPAGPRGQHRPAKTNKWRRRYVQFPWTWIERLQSATRISTYRLALLLVYEHWRTGGEPIVLTNALAMAEGVSQRSKWNVLAELEGLGLVRVERRSRKSPRLRLLHLPRDQN
jgi:hypothetical protein